ncbi:hypothetical protein [Streptomyces sp. DH24]|uniref:hypothetical protein n=1 Tax=Streptomyces sp. DH24 TaxID=3040123 RepID=UPI0024431CDE|nr:hypothetical protein [Streptomyces sp. DH24]MDG9720268.1 hypothetical protein [Streptomyces sp. DH24]
MSENTTAAGDLASQYAAQVTGDLDRNVKEQERISAEIAALQEQLATLQQDHSVLVNMQQALGVTPAPVQSAPATVPAPRTKAAPDRARKSTRAKNTKTTKTTKKETTAAPAPAKSQPKSQPKSGKPAAGKTPATAAKTAGPTLVELVRAHLAEQGEPRSAAEVATALGKTHADRSFKTTVVRNTLENLVAKGQAQRSKQGNSVFYTAPEAAERKAGAPSEEAQPERSE